MLGRDFPFVEYTHLAALRLLRHLAGADQGAKLLSAVQQGDTLLFKGKDLPAGAILEHGFRWGNEYFPLPAVQFTGNALALPLAALPEKESVLEFRLTDAQGKTLDAGAVAVKRPAAVDLKITGDRKCFPHGKKIEFSATAAKLPSGMELRVRIEDVVQTALDAVFPGAYTFKTEFVARRGRTELDMWLDKDGARMNPLNSNGGGVVDVISLALRVCCLTMSKFDKVLLLDEPFPRIRGTARQRLGEVLTLISHRLGIQVIMVADVAGTSIVPDREFRVTMDGNGKSHVEARDPEVSA
jgi:hypothetical protein